MQKRPLDLQTAALLNFAELERSETVANACMNRERNLRGPNSYQRDLKFDVMEYLTSAARRNGEASWLDICCGAGRALIEAAAEIHKSKYRIKLTGVDLIPIFLSIPEGIQSLRLIGASIEGWDTQERYDLITCVHGLHYVGDKLGVLQRSSAWLKDDGRLMMHLDYRNLKLAGGRHSGIQVGKDLRKAGFLYSSTRRLLTRREKKISDRSLPYRYLGADDKAGPNFTGQPAVDSFYERTA
ncbi:MAG: methyltransferase domain-containing protein [Acidobacteria bacterium]|nr:methyltransferase domain-containing protein [Acidobacteriota bacterium]